MSVFEFSSLWSVISSGIFNWMARAQYASFSIVAGMAVVRFLAGVQSFSIPWREFIGH